MTKGARRAPRRLLALGLAAAALALPAAAFAAEPCQADRKIQQAWLDIIGDDQRFAAVQVQGMLEILGAISQGQEPSRAVVQRVRTATTRRAQVLARGERTVKALVPGTANGRAMKQLSLRFIRSVARPFNTCVSKMLEAETPAQLKTTIECTQAVQRRTNELTRAMNRLFARMRADRRCP